VGQIVMSFFPSDPRRRFLTNLFSSLIFLAIGVALYLVRAPNYQLFFCLFFAWVLWSFYRFLKERNNPHSSAPWYYSRVKLGFVLGIGNLLVGIMGLLSHSDYLFSFLLGAAFLIAAGVYHYKEKTTAQPPADRE
jgi:hypothetical protein